MAKAKPKVTIIANRLASFGGGERWVCEAVSRLKTHLDISIINPVSDKDSIRMDEGKLRKSYELGDTRIIDIKCSGISSSAPRTGSFTMLIPSFSALARLSKTIRESDVVYEVSFNPLLLFWSIFFSRLHGKRFILGMHNPDFIIGHVSRDENGSFGSGLSGFIQDMILRSVDEIHVQTESQKKILSKMGYRKSFYYIPHFLYFNIRNDEFSSREGNFVVLFAGRLAVYQKGIDLLSEIIEKTVSVKKEIEFHIVGSGEDGEGIIMDLAKSYPRNVKKMGFLSQERLIAEYKEGCLFISSSRYETPGLTLLEAQGYGLPAVAFKVPGSEDIIKEPFQGRLIEQFDTSMFSKAILHYYRLYKNSRGDYLKLKHKIHEAISDRYSTKRFIEDFVKMIKE